jgi:ribosomal protein L29
MTLDELKKLSSEELENSILDMKKELMKLKVASMIEKKTEKPHLFKVLRKRIARAHTVRREKAQKEEV